MSLTFMKPLFCIKPVTTLRAIANSIEICIIYNCFVLNHIGLSLLQLRGWFILIRSLKHLMDNAIQRF